MRIRTVMGSLALGAALALGTTAVTAQAAPTASSVNEAPVPPGEYIGKYPSSTACHIVGTAMAGKNHTCIRKGDEYALYIFTR
ncbi:hypothetical protein ACFTZK_19220 [Streptomyces decoyicus]|uniref:hypothetical protein n=1 Tax=Streptomyces decoyicus TaxID=249567 RepID=UPI00363867DC